MAVTVTELVEYATTDNGSSYTTTSYTPTASRGLVACIFASATDHNLTPTVTGNGVTWGLEDKASRGAHAMWVFSGWSGSSPTTTGLSVEINPADPATGILVWVGELSGTESDPATFVAQVAHAAFSADVTPAVSFVDTTAADSAAIGFLGALLNPISQTAPATWTEAMDTGITSPTVGASVAYHNAPGAIASVTWGSTPTTVSTLIIMEIAAAAAGTLAADHVIYTITPTFPAAAVYMATVNHVILTVTPTFPPAFVEESVAGGGGGGSPEPSKPQRRWKRWGFVYEGQVSRQKDAPW